MELAINPPIPSTLEPRKAIPEMRTTIFVDFFCSMICRSRSRFGRLLRGGDAKAISLSYQLLTVNYHFAYKFSQSMSVFIPTTIESKFSAKVSFVLQQAGFIASILLAFAAIVTIQAPQLATLKHQNKTLNKVDLQREEAKTKVQLSLVKTLPTFGLKNLVADWYFLDFLQYSGDGEARQIAGYGSALDYFDVILDRDPRFFYAYYYLSNAGALYAGQPERSVALMDRGLKSLTPKIPDGSYYIWRLKAVDELLFLGKVPDARKSMLMAAEWAKVVGDEEGLRVATLSEKTAGYLARNPKSKQAQFDAWSMVLGTAVDEPVIRRAVNEIRALGGKVTVDANGKLKVNAPHSD